MNNIMDSAARTTTQYNERSIVRREIQTIIARNISERGRRRLNQRGIIEQSFMFESLLYHHASCIEQYGDRETLEARVIKAANALFYLRHRNERSLNGAVRA
mmetsp:Transcript_15737/g.33070  ORF Transcript_15737/g.33070 Transcript_15737/m.33070 type:complete len:102 (+) Transcript_15737:24-329(+)